MRKNTLLAKLIPYDRWCVALFFILNLASAVMLPLEMRAQQSGDASGITIINSLGETITSIDSDGKLTIGNSDPSYSYGPDDVLFKAKGNFHLAFPPQIDWLYGSTRATFYRLCVDTTDWKFYKTRLVLGDVWKPFAQTLIGKEKDVEDIFFDLDGYLSIGARPSLMDQDALLGIGGSVALKMLINGGVITKKLFVSSDNVNWKDVVFSEDYNLMPLEEVRNHIEKNGALPNVPSQKEIDEKGTIDMVETTTMLLEKVEELTLYLIQQERQIQEMEKELQDKKDKTKETKK